MFFKAKMNKKDFEIEVKETKNSYVVELVDVKSNEKQVHEVMKWDYIRIDDAISFLFNNTSYMINVVLKGVSAKVFTRGSYREIKLFNDQILLQESIKGVHEIGGDHDLKSGMPGKIIDILVKKGDKVVAGEPILVMEAMKMENEMRATSDVVIKKVLVKKGQNVEASEVLVLFEK